MTQQINLFNPLFLKQRNIFSAAAMAPALGLLLAGMLAMGWYARQNVGQLQAEADSGRDLLAQREERLNKVKTEFAPRVRSADMDTELAEAEARIVALRKVAGVIERGELGNKRGYAEYFRALARQNVAGVWLTGVSISGAGNELGLQGRALDPALVPAYLGRLAHEPVMRGKTFGSLNITRAGAKDAPPAAFVEFSLDATPAEAAQ